MASFFIGGGDGGPEVDAQLEIRTTIAFIFSRWVSPAMTLLPKVDKGNLKYLDFTMTRLTKEFQKDLTS